MVVYELSNIIVSVRGFCIVTYKDAVVSLAPDS